MSLNCICSFLAVGALGEGKKKKKEKPFLGFTYILSSYFTAWTKCSQIYLRMLLKLNVTLLTFLI